MTEKEVAEIRRRFKTDKCNISRIRGCYVNDKGEVVSQFNQSLVEIAQEEADNMLALMKKTLSGGLNKNLIDIEFSNEQVLGGDEHKNLLALRESSLNDDEAVNNFYQRAIDAIEMDGPYLIMLANDKYDVFTYSSDGQQNEDSTEIFSYIVCAICPIKLTKPALSYLAYENAFKNVAGNTIVGAPEIGFMFPTFDDRTANIYNSLFYTKNTADNHDAFVDSIFKSEIPMPALVQKETFQNLLTETITDDCNYEVVQAVHEELAAIIEEHKASKQEEPLKIGKNVITNVLESHDIDEDKIKSFDKQYDEDFGENAEISPQNIVDVKKFEVNTADVSIKVNPERSDLVRTKIIDGTKYIMIKADENVEVNGVNITIS